jgi:hypothetical protein
LTLPVFIATTFGKSLVRLKLGLLGRAGVALLVAKRIRAIAIGFIGAQRIEVLP